tara:strand:- start:21 stop:467 length:447 start_codon:yes stop_codon:yes gene_type:complete
MIKLVSVVNNLVRTRVNGGWYDMVNPSHTLAFPQGHKLAGKVPNIEEVDVCFEGHLSQSDWLSTKAGKDGSISGKALLALATKVAEAKGNSATLVVEESKDYEIVAKKIDGKATNLRTTTTKYGDKLTFVTFRIPYVPEPVAGIQCDI